MGKKIDLTGQKFGSLVVIEDSLKRSTSGSIIWKCRCECGNFTNVEGWALRKKIITRCHKCGMASLRKDITGQKFNHLTAIEPTDKRNNREVIWKFQCDCGNIIEQRSSVVTNNIVKSCGCFQYQDQIHDISGQRFGKLVALHATNERKGRSVVWACRCDCGTICKVPITTLLSNHMHSCGCIYKPNLQGKKFGQLTVLESTSKRNSNREIVWKCRCNCGNIHYVGTSQLTTGNTQSCGCVKSHGEANIKLFLSNKNIQYETQYKFNDCKYKNTLFFDIAILQNNKLICLIEYNGKQHYTPIDYFGGDSYFQGIIIRDNVKKEYCQQHNIPLHIIRYDENLEQRLEEILNEYQLSRNS